MIILRVFGKMIRLIFAGILTVFVWAFDILGRILSFAGAFAVWIFIICIITVCICGLWSSLPLLLGIIGACVVTLIKVFRKINSVLSSQRDALPEEKKWTVFTLIVDSDLHMKALFEYEDHTEDRIEYEENWRTKFLRKD